MKPTVEYLEERFDTFNGMCFGGALPRIPIKLSNARSFVGRLQYRPVRDWLGRIVRREDFVLRISTRFDLPENELEDILLHEMIHYEILVGQRRDTSAHGRLFRARMQEINERYGRHITISHRSGAPSPAVVADAKPTWRVVAHVRFKDGREGIKVLPRILQRLKSYRRGLQLSGEVASIDFYLTSDPYFSRFLKSSALNVIFPSDGGVFTAHLRPEERLQNLSL